MTENQRNLAVRLLREQHIALSQRNEVMRKNFGDRLTKALNAECEQRDREIEALELTIDLLNKVKVVEIRSA